jgi:gluconolactonase
MATFKCSLLFLVVFLNTALSVADEQPTQIEGIGPARAASKLHTGFDFTEGPAVDPAGNIFFTDVPRSRIYQSDTAGQLTTFLEGTQGCNGLMFDAQGRLLCCQSQVGRVIAIDVTNKKIEVIADQYDGKRFTNPNDLVVDRRGGVYFTDPFFGEGEQVQDKEGVYYVTPAGTVTRLVDDQPQPNGVLLSPDEKTLYVLLSGRGALMAYPIERPGQIGPGTPLGEVPRLGDGLTVDTAGNLYLTQPPLRAILVLSPTGKTLGMIRVPEEPSNCTFGGVDMKTLFVTARTSLYAFPMAARGHRFAASAAAPKPAPE